jgi:putative ABC transport system ATP-binding protein
VTHDATVAGYADREIPLRDGMVDDGTLGLAAAAAAGGETP